MAEALLTPSAASTPDELLEASWAGRRRSIRGRELRLELGLTAAFLVAAGALLAVAAPVPAPHAVTAALVLAYAVAARTAFPIGAGVFAPTQLFLVPLFAVAPAALVPPLVLGAYVLAAVAAAVTRRANLDRLVFCGGDAFHALGPALVLTVFAAGDGTGATAWVIAAAFGAQLLADAASSSVRELLSTGATARVHARLLVQVWGADVALGTVGLLAAWAATIEPWAALAPVPLLLLMRALAADRVRKIGAAHERLVALEQERGRRQAAAQLLERHNQFLQDVSHELRTPVTIARGHLELLRRNSGPSPESEIAIDELQRIERIIERLLILARAQHPGSAARRRLEAEVFVEDRFVRWSDTVPRAWRLGDLVAGTIQADPDALCAALDALIENAVRHTDPAQSITVRSRAEDGTLVIEVSDEGSGIAPEAMQEIFKRFARADPVQQRPAMAAASAWPSSTPWPRRTAARAPSNPRRRAPRSRCACRTSSPRHWQPLEPERRGARGERSRARAQQPLRSVDPWPDLVRDLVVEVAALPVEGALEDVLRVAGGPDGSGSEPVVGVRPVLVVDVDDGEALEAELGLVAVEPVIAAAVHPGMVVLEPPDPPHLLLVDLDVDLVRARVVFGVAHLDVRELDHVGLGRGRRGALAAAEAAAGGRSSRWRRPARPPAERLLLGARAAGSATAAPAACRRAAAARRPHPGWGDSSLAWATWPPPSIARAVSVIARAPLILPRLDFNRCCIRLCSCDLGVGEFVSAR